MNGKMRSHFFPTFVVRSWRGAEIVRKHQVRKLGFGNYEVRSQSRKGVYYMVASDKLLG